jgi:hypothetical protein
MPYIGDDYLTVKQYQALRQKYREARTTTPWKPWAAHYLSPAGKRNRELVKAQGEAKARTTKANLAGIRDQIRTMDEETKAAGLDPVRQEQVAQLLVQANERDWDTAGDYSVRAVQAQRRLRELGVDPAAVRTG